jgi:inhibitor of cysteine peptidase
MLRRYVLAFACSFTLACAGPRALEADRPYEAGLASVERIDVHASTGEPVSVRVDAAGTLPDACTTIDRVRQERRGSGVSVSITTRREFGASCAAQPRPFRQAVLLDIVGLAPGLYFVEVNGVEGTFQIYEDLGAPDRYDRPRGW